MMKLYIGDTSELVDDEIYEKIYNLIPPFRRASVNKIIHTSSKRQSVAAFALLLYGVCELGYDFDELGYAIDENGKPYFAKQSGLFFSLSHSAERVMCAVSGAPVGCDIEKHAPKNIEKIAKRFFHPDEYEFLVTTNDEADKVKAFFDLWTKKESYIKMTGLGMKQPLNDFCVDCRKNILCHGDEEVVFIDVCCDAGYSASVCTKDGSEKISIVNVDFKNVIDCLVHK